ncbi:MAG TPA: hypothetical protein DCY88_27865 [Cyanobacteria bacterium UBA11372]|nr:hypothetical protein [Cyanobacteria bacterium UBA11372]
MSYSIKAKLMIAVTSAVVLGMSAFIQPAEAAKKQGETYSQPSEDEQKIDIQFSLVNQTRSGQPIVAQPVEQENIVLGRRFLGAIENYTKGLGELCNTVDNEKDQSNPICQTDSHKQGNYFFNSDGYPIFKMDFAPNATPFDGDLVAQVFKYRKGEKPIFINAKEDKNLQQFFGENTDITDVVVYSILKPQEDESMFSYLLKLGDIPESEQCQNKGNCRYVNDLEFILKNSLLSKAVPVRTINSSGLPNQARALIQNKFEQEVPVATVPEPSITLGALAAVGAGSLLKRKAKQS